MGEVDYTKSRILKTTTILQGKHNININDLDEVTNILKDTRLFTVVHFQEFGFEKAFDHSRFEILATEESLYKCTLSTLTAFYESRQIIRRH